MASGIRWKRGDYISLGRTIAEFNKKINELETEENKLYLPEKINYATAKEDIKTRNELNRFIKNLRNFTADTAGVITLESGNKLLEWDYENLKNLRRTATRRLQNINVNKEVQPYETQEETLARANINYMKSLETADKEKFDRIRQNLYRVGRADYTYKKALVYQQNYLDNYEEAFGNYENFEILKNKLESIKNPIKFFDYIQQDDALADLFLYYDKSKGLVYAGANDEDSFNSILVRLGLIE